MSKPLSQEELSDNEELCQYCLWTDRGLQDIPQVYCTGGEPVMCEGSWCNDAYEYYLGEFEEENEEMSNLEKAKLITSLSAEIKKHTENIEELNKRQKKFREGEKAYISLHCYWNFETNIEADEVLIECMIVNEKVRLSKAEKELDELLNGDVNRIKDMLNMEQENNE